MNDEYKVVLMMTVGAPGSGKSTWAKTFAQAKSLTYLSSDEQRAKFGTSENDQSVTPRVFSYLKDKVGQLLSVGISVMLDATNMSKKDRKDFLEKAKSHNAYTIAAVFEVDKNTLIKRNVERGAKGGRNVPEEVLDRMLNKYQRPDETEFDKVIFK